MEKEEVKERGEGEKEKDGEYRGRAGELVCGLKVSSGYVESGWIRNKAEGIELMTLKVGQGNIR